jgi:hypothetical protein
MSESIPFLLKPKNLDGYIGNIGFDPLGFSDYFDMKWLRESELKHCRVAMLAAVGFIVSEFVTIPGYEHVDDSNLAPAAVGTAAMLQIVFGVGLLEFYSNKGKVTMENMFDDKDRVPGKFGFDGGYYAKNSKADMDVMELKELSNGRLAMLAIGGMIHHNWITGEPLL